MGDQPAVGRLLDGAARLALTPHDLVRMTWLREIFYDGASGDPNAVGRLVTAARDVAGQGDRNLALNLLQGAALRCWRADQGLLREVSSLKPSQKSEMTISIQERSRSWPWRPRSMPGARVSAGVELAAATDEADPSRAQILGLAAHAAGDFGHRRSPHWSLRLQLRPIGLRNEVL